MIYKTNKESVSPQYSEEKMKFSDIDGIDRGRELLFPTVTVRKKNGNAYKVLVFNRKKFLNRYAELEKNRH